MSLLSIENCLFYSLTCKQILDKRGKTQNGCLFTVCWWKSIKSHWGRLTGDCASPLAEGWTLAEVACQTLDNTHNKGGQGEISSPLACFCCCSRNDISHTGCQEEKTFIRVLSFLVLASFFIYLLFQSNIYSNVKWRSDWAVWHHVSVCYHEEIVWRCLEALMDLDFHLGFAFECFYQFSFMYMHLYLFSASERLICL